MGPAFALGQLLAVLGKAVRALQRGVLSTIVINTRGCLVPIIEPLARFADQAAHSKRCTMAINASWSIIIQHCWLESRSFW